MLTVTDFHYTGFIKARAPNSSGPSAVTGGQKKSKLMVCFFDAVQNSTEILNRGLDGCMRLSFHTTRGASIGCGRGSFTFLWAAWRMLHLTSSRFGAQSLPGFRAHGGECSWETGPAEPSAIFRRLSSVTEHRICNAATAGSIPRGGTSFSWPWAGKKIGGGETKRVGLGPPLIH